MTPPALSIVVATVMSDHPFLGRPDLHIFAPLAETLARQDAPRGSFELIVVDSMWATRGDWFAGQQLPFKVTHVSSLPNPFHERGRCGANGQMNRGLLWAAGDYVFWGHENCMYPSGFVTEALRLFATGRIPLAWFLGDMEHMPPEVDYPWTPVPYSMCGYTGRRSNIEYRAERVLNGWQAINGVPWQWYYTYSGAPRELLMALHGWDTNLDGEGYVTDCDVGSRIEMATSPSIFCMSPHLYVVEAQQLLGDWSGNVKSSLPVLKCNYALLLYNRYLRRTIGGQPLGGTELLDLIPRECCEQMCHCHDQCRREDVIYPFVPKRDRALFDEWQELTARCSWERDAAGVLARRAPYDQAYIHEAV